MRVKLQSEAPLPFIRCWHLVNQANDATIQNVIDSIALQFGIQETPLSLSIQGFILPMDGPTSSFLQVDDLIMYFEYLI